MTGRAQHLGAQEPRERCAPAPRSWNRIVVETKDLDVTLARTLVAGGRTRSKPINGPGGRQLVVIDPSGNAAEVFEAGANG